MNKTECIQELKTLLEITDPQNKPEAIRNFVSAVTLVNWVTRRDEKAFDEFSCFLSAFEVFVFQLNSEATNITRNTCQGELDKLPTRL